LNPDFHTSIHVLYSFEKVQKIRFEFIDDDGMGDKDDIGSIETTIGDIMGSMAQTWTGTLAHKGKANRGMCIVRAECLVESND
jgi:hypothetical protein